MPRAKKNIPVSEVLELIGSERTSSSLRGVMPNEVVEAPLKPVENLQPSTPSPESTSVVVEQVKVKKERAPRKPKETPLVAPVASTPVPVVVEQKQVEVPKEKPKKTTKEPSELDLKKKLLKDREMLLKEKQLALKELELEKKRLRLEAQSNKPIKVVKEPFLEKRLTQKKEEPEYLPDSDDEKIANLKASMKAPVAVPKLSTPSAPKVVPQVAPKLTPQQILAMGGF